MPQIRLDWQFPMRISRALALRLLGCCRGTSHIFAIACRCTWCSGFSGMWVNLCVSPVTPVDSWIPRHSALGWSESEASPVLGSRRASPSTSRCRPWGSASRIPRAPVLGQPGGGGFGGWPAPTLGKAELWTNRRSGCCHAGPTVRASFFFRPTPFCQALWKFRLPLSCKSPR